MVSWIISRIVVLAFGTLYPAYSSYKAVKTKNVKEYVKWMMYWIVFALFSTAETVTDLVLSWFPFYFELKIAFVIWLLSPYTKGSSVLYRKFVHPTLSNKEKEIDEYITQAKDKSYETMMRFGKRGLNIAATAAVTAATKVLAEAVEGSPVAAVAVPVLLVVLFVAALLVAWGIRRSKSMKGSVAMSRLSHSEPLSEL
ncbi:unnamed protein product [Boreogadus saida]